MGIMATSRESESICKSCVVRVYDFGNWRKAYIKKEIVERVTMLNEAHVFVCLCTILAYGQVNPSEGDVGPSIMVYVDVGLRTLRIPVDATTTVLGVKAKLHRQACFEHSNHLRSSTPLNEKQSLDEYSPDTQIRINLYTVTNALCGLVSQRSELPLEDDQTVVDIIEKELTKKFAARITLCNTPDIFTEVRRYQDNLEGERKRWEETKR